MLLLLLFERYRRTCRKRSNVMEYRLWHIVNVLLLLTDFRGSLCSLFTSDSFCYLFNSSTLLTLAHIFLNTCTSNFGKQFTHFKVCFTGNQQFNFLLQSSPLENLLLGVQLLLFSFKKQDHLKVFSAPIL